MCAFIVVFSSVDVNAAGDKERRGVKFAFRLILVKLDCTILQPLFVRFSSLNRVFIFREIKRPSMLSAENVSFYEFLLVLTVLFSLFGRC